MLRDVARYERLGEHRTGTKGDLAASRWIARSLEAAGLPARLHELSLQQFFLTACRLTVGRRAVESFPLWFPRTTGPRGVSGPLAPGQADVLDGAIALLKFPHHPSGTVWTGSGHDEIVARAAQRGAVAAVAITESPSGELVALNLAGDQPPWPIPVVLVGGRAGSSLEWAAQRRANACVVVRGRQRETGAHNVVARSRRARGPMMVVSVAHSGWFQCAGERGTGVAAFLALARWVGARSSPLRFRFIATTGHELGSRGLRALLDDGALPEPAEVACWFHIGPAIATKAWRPRGAGERARTHLLVSGELAPLLGPPLLALPRVEGPVTDWAVGDLLLLRRHGYAAGTLLSTYALHHTRRDRIDQVAPELLEPVLRAMSAVVEAVEGGDKAAGRS